MTIPIVTNKTKATAAKVAIITLSEIFAGASPVNII